MTNCRLIDCKTGLIVYRERNEFGPARMSVRNLELKNIRTRYLLDEKSALAIDGKFVRHNKDVNSTPTEELKKMFMMGE